MKKFLLFFVLVFAVSMLWAQAPQKMTYQAVVRNAGNSLVVNQNVSVRISIIQGSEYGASEYVEKHTVTTNSNGLMTLEVGSGTVINGVFSNINWANGPYFLKSEIDPTGGSNWTITGMQELLSVPYALYAAKAGNVPAFAVVPTDTGYVINIAQNGATPQTLILRQGTPGPQGPQGEPGTPGEPGEQGEQGIQGIPGADGLSAYQMWLNAGHTGNEAAFLDSLRGPQGPQGDPGTPGEQGEQGEQGEPGPAGLSAYQIWLNAGHTGNEAAFLDSLRGLQGDKGDKGDKGDTGDTGADGRGITNVVGPIPTEVPLQNQYTIIYTNGETSTFTVMNGAQGPKGDQGDPGEPGPKGDKGDQGDPGEPGLKGDKGDQGNPGEPGPKGDQGDPGVSPTVVATPAGDSTVVVITDAEGDHRFVLYNGAQGPKGDQGDPGEPGLKGDKGDQGDPGVSPTIVATPAGDSTVVVITDAEGDHRFVLYNGAQGPKGDKGDQGDPGEPGLKGDKGDQGDPGVSPTVVATSASDSTVVVITDAEGDHRFVLYNGAQGSKGDPGEPGLKGDKGDQGDPGVSPTVVATPAGDSTVVVITDTEGDHRFVLYNGTQGPKGEQGPAGVGVPQTLSIVGTSLTISDGNTVQIPTVGGTNGLSAYEVWLQQGHTGSEADFLDSLKGATGATGPQGPQGETGATGSEGPAGLSAYQIWLNAGHTGTEADFLDSLRGAQGPQGPQGETGATGPEGPAGVGIPQTLTLDGYYLSISDGNYVMLPEGFSGSYLELTNKPLFHNVATTGNYNDLNNKPEIPTIPTVVSAFDNDAGYITKDSVPTNLSAFTNDAGFLVADDLTSLNDQISAQQAAVEDLQQQVGNIPVNCPSFVQDFDGNSYNTVRIGNQCWMKENLRAVHYADGSDVMNYSHVKDSAVYDLTYGLVYDWDAVMNGTAASTSATDRVQGICPSGWHLPSVAEINVLVNYVGSQSEYVCGGSSAAIAKALATTTGWRSVMAGDTCLPGYHPELNNATGLSIQPAGYYFSPRNSYRYFGESGYFWTSSPSLIEAGCSYGIEYNEPEVIVITNSDMTSVRNHVRCLRDNSIGDAINEMNENMGNMQQEMQQEVENVTFVCGTSTVSDYDGNVYNTVKIGNQCWLKENIRTTHYTDGTEIPVGSGGENDGIYRCYPGNSESNVAVYGYLYPWNAVTRGASSSTANPSGVQGICPVGWHVPSPAEWTQLTNYVSGRSEYLCGGKIGKALSMPMGWLAPADSCGSGNPVGGNATGFSALPAGGEALPLGSFATFWSARAMEYTGDYFEIYYDGVAHLSENDLYEGLSVRCVRDELSQMDNVMDNLQQNLLEQMRNMIAPLREQINQLQNEINQQQHTIDSLSREVVLSTCGLITVSDIDGNEYHTVRIGKQCWMKENLRTEHYADGTPIALGTSASITDPYCYNPNNDAGNVLTYGYLYNWAAVMNGAASSNANPSGVQGICPNGWHVPSDAEWTQLIDYVGSQSQYVCGSSNNIAKALAATTGWNTDANTCTVGNTSSGNNNATGFSALPAGYSNGTPYGFGKNAFFWSTTKREDENYSAYNRVLSYNKSIVNRNNDFKNMGLSVRCVRD